MGEGLELARNVAPEHVAMLENLRDQLLIVFLRRLGGNVSIPVAEIDDTANCLLSMNVVDGVFNFNLEKKQ